MSGWCQNEPLAFLPLWTYHYILRCFLHIEHHFVYRKCDRKKYFIFYLFSLCRFRSIYSDLPLAALCIGCFCRNFDSYFIYPTFVLFPRFEDQKYLFLGLESAKIEKITLFFAFFCQNIWSYQKKAVPLHSISKRKCSKKFWGV